MVVKWENGATTQEIIIYIGRIPQQLDTDVHSAMTVKMSTALWQQKQAQHGYRSGSDSAQWDNDVHTTNMLTMLATNSAATALSVASTFTVICTSLYHTNVNITVTALSVVSTVSCQYFHSNMHITVTPMWISLSQHCQLPVLSEWYTVDTALILMWTSLSQRCQCDNNVNLSCCATALGFVQTM